MEINKLIGKQFNKPSIVLAHGPSLDLYPHNKSQVFLNKYVTIGCNEWYKFYNTPPRYWVFANNEITMKNRVDTINGYYDGTVVYADSVDLTDAEWVKQNIKVDYVTYDQRHFNRTECKPKSKCCDNIKNRSTIQELLRDYCEMDYSYSSGDTVAVHMLALAILLGCNPIYFIGMDLNYTKGYAKTLNGKNPSTSTSPPNVLDGVKTNILNDLNIIKHTAKHGGVDIFNLDPNSDLEFPKYKIEDL